MAPRRRTRKSPGKRQSVVAKVLFEASRSSDGEVSEANGVSQRTIKRWRAQELAGKLPEVSTELARLRAEAADEVKAKAEHALDAVFDFLEKATQGDPKDPKMVEAIVKAGEFLADTIAMTRMMHVQSAGSAAKDRAPARAVADVAGGTRAAGASTGSGGRGNAAATGTGQVH